jgi:hypothetical protein
MIALVWIDMKAHPEILLVNSHMMPEFFENPNGLAQKPVA